MNEQEVVAVVEKLKGTAQACPWVPLGVPPRQHFHRFSSGLSICFTLDILPGARYWHLSIAKVPGYLTGQEIEFWRRAFFDEPPTIELPSQIPGVESRHFYWRAEDGAGKSTKNS
ncbi:hypothetical protein ES703_90275 [subsurface metagenome]